jgi:formate-dependent nitrite reductase membrane component NrfD
VKLANWNMFAVWFFLPHTLAMGWIAFAGRMLLELLGANTQEGDIPGRLAGMVIWLTVIVLVRHRFAGKLPIVGNPAGNGYRFAHRLLFIANILAALLLAFEFKKPYLDNHDLIHVLSTFTDAFGYWVMGMWAVGLSFLYQSTLKK